MRGLALVLLLLAGCAPDDSGALPGPDVDAGNAASELGPEAAAERPDAHDAAPPDQAADVGVDLASCPFTCQKPDPAGMGRCIDTCPEGKCCCAMRNACLVRLSPSECCR